MQEIVVKGQTGFVKIYPMEPYNFREIQGIELPKTNVYLLLDPHTYYGDLGRYLGELEQCSG